VGKTGNVPGTDTTGGLRWRSGQGAALLVGRSRDRFPVVSLDFSVTYSFQPYHGPGVDSGPSENEYQEHFLGVKAAGAWGWQPHHLHVSNLMKLASLKLLEHSGPHRACYGTLLPLPYWHNLSQYRNLNTQHQNVFQVHHSTLEFNVTSAFPSYYLK